MVNVVLKYYFKILGLCVVSSPQFWVWLNIDMSEKPIREKSNRGGAREGAGRKAGSTQKLSASDILRQCEAVIGKPFAVSLVEGYKDAITNNDTKLRHAYEKVILDKTATTMFEADVVTTGDAVDAKQQAFIEALSSLANINKDKE